jgi:hypothetical protein
MLEWEWTFGVGGSASLSGLVWLVGCGYQGRTRTGIASNLPIRFAHFPSAGSGDFAWFRNAVGVFGRCFREQESPQDTECAERES